MSGLNSPHDNLPELEGDIWTLTVRLVEPVEYEGEQREEVTFTTIQPSKEDAYKRVLYLVRVEWDAEIDAIVDAERLEGTRHEQLETLAERFDENEPNVTSTVIYELVETFEQLPDVLAFQMYQNMPEKLQDVLDDELPKQFLKRIQRFERAG